MQNKEKKNYVSVRGIASQPSSVGSDAHSDIDFFPFSHLSILFI